MPFLFVLLLWLLNLLPVPREGYTAQTRRGLCQGIDSLGEPREGGTSFFHPGRRTPSPSRRPTPPPPPHPGFPPKLSFIVAIRAHTQIHIKMEGKWDSLAKVNGFRGSRGFAFL